MLRSRIIQTINAFFLISCSHWRKKKNVRGACFVSKKANTQFTHTLSLFVRGNIEHIKYVRHVDCSRFVFQNENDELNEQRNV